MNFFRSEEHLRKWEGYAPGKEGGTIALPSLMWLFSGPYFQKRRDPDYMSHYGEYMADMMGKLDKLQGAGDFWRLNPLEKTAFSLGRKLKIL
ncbi:MAG: hypothetical protein AB1921_11820 [Thermodesulfobacteriota bacterium]